MCVCVCTCYSVRDVSKRDTERTTLAFCVMFIVSIFDGYICLNLPLSLGKRHRAQTVYGNNLRMRRQCIPGPLLPQEGLGTKLGKPMRRFIYFVVSRSYQLRIDHRIR